jgi:hypothetical protein
MAPPLGSKQSSYKRKMKKSNVVVLINITQETYAKLLLEITEKNPELKLINSGFERE